MSFGYSVGDFVLLVQLAHKAFRNCQQAGKEYLEIASEVRCLHSVLRILRAEAKKPKSKIFRQNSPSRALLIETADGCKDVLNSLHAMLVKYDGLDLDSQAGIGKKLRHRLGFGSKIAELGVIRGKLITYTSTISVLIDTMQLQGTERIETKVEGGFADVKVEMRTQFELLRKEIYTIVSQKRAEERTGATVSSLSLSTYAGDEKTVWQDFRRELIAKGYRSDSLERHKDIIQAYMMRLDQSGLLDRDQNSTIASLKSIPWWSNRMHLDTVDSFTDTQPDIDPVFARTLPSIAHERDSDDDANDSNGSEPPTEVTPISNAPRNDNLNSYLVAATATESAAMEIMANATAITSLLLDNRRDLHDGQLQERLSTNDDQLETSSSDSSSKEGLRSLISKVDTTPRSQAIGSFSTERLNIQQRAEALKPDAETSLPVTKLPMVEEQHTNDPGLRWMVRLQELDLKLRAEREARLLDRSSAGQRLENKTRENTKLAAQTEKSGIGLLSEEQRTIDSSPWWMVRLQELDLKLKAEREARLLDQSSAGQRLENKTRENTKLAAQTEKSGIGLLLGEEQRTGDLSLK